MGITNLVFPNERDDAPGCSPLATPRDTYNLGAVVPAVFDDVTAFATFMRLLGPPAPAPQNNTATHGASMFASVGCAHCHSATLQTGASESGASLSNQGAWASGVIRTFNQLSNGDQQAVLDFFRTR